MNEDSKAAAWEQALIDCHPAGELTWRQRDSGVDQHAGGGIGCSVCVGAALGDVGRAWLGPIGGGGPAALRQETQISLAWTTGLGLSPYWQ